MYSMIWKILFQKYVSSHKGDMYLFKKGTFKETTMTFLHEMLFEIGAMKKWENIEWKDYQKQRINISLSLCFLCFPSFLWAWQSPTSYRQVLKITTLYFWTRWSQQDCSALALPVCLLSEVVSCMFIQSGGGKPGRDRERKTEAKTTFQFVWTCRQYELEEIA